MVSGIVLLRKGANADEALAGIHAKVKELNDHILPAGVKVVPFIDRSDLVHYTTHTVLHNLTEGIILVVIVLFLFLGNVRGAIIVALTVPFSLLFAATCLNLKDIPANLLSLGALDFGMVVDGAVVMVENIVRHMVRRQNGNDSRSTLEVIREAAHEVQRPVFYAIAIIITAYLPIFTLQRVEGRLFKPMAWTVAFALLGALLFSMLVAPVLSSFLFSRTMREWRNPVLIFLTDRYRKAVRWAIEHRWMTLGTAVLGLCRRFISYVRRRHRFGVSSASGRGRALGARHSCSQHRTQRGYPRSQPGPRPALLFSRSSSVHQPSRASRRRHGYDGFFQYRILRRFEAEGTVAARFSPEQR